MSVFRTGKAPGSILDLLAGHALEVDREEKHGTGKSREPAGWKACIATARFVESSVFPGGKVQRVLEEMLG